MLHSEQYDGINLIAFTHSKHSKMKSKLTLHSLPFATICCYRRWEGQAIYFVSHQFEGFYLINETPTCMVITFEKKLTTSESQFVVPKAHILQYCYFRSGLRLFV